MKKLWHLPFLCTLSLFFLLASIISLTVTGDQLKTQINDSNHQAKNIRIVVTWQKAAKQIIIAPGTPFLAHLDCPLQLLDIGLPNLLVVSLNEVKNLQHHVGQLAKLPSKNITWYQTSAFGLEILAPVLFFIFLVDASCLVIWMKANINSHLKITKAYQQIRAAHSQAQKHHFQKVNQARINALKIANVTRQQHLSDRVKKYDQNLKAQIAKAQPWTRSHHQPSKSTRPKDQPDPAK